MKTITTLAFCALTLTASARIGDTPDQLFQRYGTPTIANKIPNQEVELYTFKTPQNDVTATVFRGICTKIQFFKHVGETWQMQEAYDTLKAAVAPEYQNWNGSLATGFISKVGGIKIVAIQKPAGIPDGKGSGVVGPSLFLNAESIQPEPSLLDAKSTHKGGPPNGKIK